MVMTRAQRVKENHILESSNKPAPIVNKFDELVQENEKLKQSEAAAFIKVIKYENLARDHACTIKQLIKEIAFMKKSDDVAIMKARAQQDAIKSRKFPASEMVTWTYIKDTDLIATKQEVANYMKTIKRLTEENESLRNEYRDVKESGVSVDVKK